MSALEKINGDIEELQKLTSLATRERVKNFLSLELRKLQTEASVLSNQEKVKNTDATSAGRTSVKGIKNSLIKLTDYAWDQSEKFVKVYVTIKDVQKASTDDFQLKSTARSFEFDVSNVENKNYSLTIKNLTYDINPSASYHKVKTDMVVLFLKKVSSNSWSHITAQDKKSTEKSVPKLDENDDADPSAKMMGLLKQMYDEGDDDMKRNIAKSWAESRNKPDMNMGMP